MKSRFIENINSAIFILYLFLYLTIFEFFEKNDLLFDLRHFLLLFAIMISFASLIAKYGKKFYKKDLMGKSLLLVVPLGILFILISAIKAAQANTSFSFRSLVQTFMFVGPTLYAFNLVNIISPKKIFLLLKISTWILIFFYFTETEHQPLAFLDLDNWKKIKLFGTDSFTESHICSESFLQLFLLFFYINYTDRDRTTKNTKLYAAITAIFTILSFKRLAVALVIFILLGQYFVRYTQKINIKGRSLIIASVFTIATIAYLSFLRGDLIAGVNIDKITTNRGYILSLWEKHNYYSYGYGTSLYIIGRYLEMDLIQIYVEIGIVSLWLFCYVYAKSAKNRLYPNIIIAYVLLNLLTSSTMPWSSGWIFFAITLIYTSARINTWRKNTQNKCIESKNSRRKILIIDHCVDVVGGVERVICTLSNELIKKYDIEVLSEYDLTTKPFFKYSPKVKKTYLVNRTKDITRKIAPSNPISKIIRLSGNFVARIIEKNRIRTAMIQREDIDIIIFGRVFTSLRILPTIEFLELKPKIIVRDAIHPLDMKKTEKNKMKKIFPPLINTFIVSSDESKKTYEKFFKNKKVNIIKIYNPLTIKPKNSWDEYKNKTITAIGRIDNNQKGIDVLVLAFSLIHQKHPDWKLTIFGDGTYRKKIEKLTDQSKISNITFHNYTKSITHAFRRTSIFAFPSRYEGYANTLVEALACGVPSVTFDWLMGAEEIIENNKTGIIVPLQNRLTYYNGEVNQKDIKNLAEAICNLIEHKDFAKQIANNAPSIISSRSKDKILKEWENLIEN